MCGFMVVERNVGSERLGRKKRRKEWVGSLRGKGLERVGETDREKGESGAERRRKGGGAKGGGRKNQG